jgi:hypothetical protein
VTNLHPWLRKRYIPVPLLPGAILDGRRPPKGRAPWARRKWSIIRWMIDPPSGFARDGEPRTFERSRMRSEESVESKAALAHPMRSRHWCVPARHRTLPGLLFKTPLAYANGVFSFIPVSSVNESRKSVSVRYRDSRAKYDIYPRTSDVPLSG